MADFPSDRVDIYTRVTNKIVEAIEAGQVKGYEMPWHVASSGGYPVNATTGQAYRGVNVLTLWVEALEKGYTDATWATYKQWQELGKQVAKGEKSATGVFFKKYEGNASVPVEDDAETENKGYMVAKAFSLFNACQIEGYEPPQIDPKPHQQRIEGAEVFFHSLGADIRHGGSRAFYRASQDYIQMPVFEAFVDPVAYYGTLAHEATHWTAHPFRLDRDLKGRFGDESYAAEELIAELGAAFVSASLELTVEPREDHAAYIQSWLKILKNDSRAIFAAASHAQKAADFLHDINHVDLAIKPISHCKSTPQP